MPKRPPSFIVRKQAYGTRSELDAEINQVDAKARQLLALCPKTGPEKQLYVGDKFRECLNGRVDREVFDRFISLAGAFVELQACSPRILKERKDRQ